MEQASILIVTDDATLASDLRLALSELGHIASAAPTGETAQEEIADGKADLILIDIRLSGKSGRMEAAERIRSISKAPIAFLTDDSDAEHFSAAERIGPCAYVSIPLKKEELRKAVGAALRLGRMERELEECEERLVRTADQKNEQIEKQNRALERADTAMRILLSKRVDEKRKIEEAIACNIRHLLLPCVEELKETALSEAQQACVERLEAHLKDVASSFVRSLSDKFLTLTPTEIRIAKMIRDGLRSSQICDALRVSASTVRTHRESVREKLGLKNRKLNLRSYLRSLE